MYHTMDDLNPKEVTLLEGFWKERNHLLADVIIPYQWDTLNNRTEGVPLSHAVENFRIAAKELEGIPGGTIFQDSDVAKWIEAASYSLMFQPNSELEASIDELVRLIEKSQHSNGYVNTFFTAKGIEQRWSDLEMGHELYCAGHLIEASITYYQATGKRRLMDVMIRYANLIAEEFGPEKGKLHAYDGHPEIEIALYRLAAASDDERYMNLADYFMNIRGSVRTMYATTNAEGARKPKSRWFEADYFVADKPIRSMTEVTGHAVRAMYLYAGMTDQCRHTGEPELWETLTELWNNLAQKRVYITGAIGSQSHGERFTVDYDLPPDRGYTETCASIGLVFWAWRMSLIDMDSRYADMIERAMYNGALSGISLDGKTYFYVNPLEIIPSITTFRHDMEHVLPHRAGWFDCACCPTNIARLIGSIGKYIYSFTDTHVYIHQYISSEAEVPLGNQKVSILQETKYPWNGEMHLTMHMQGSVQVSLSLRKPHWCDDFKLLVNGTEWDGWHMEKGYITIDRVWASSDTVALELEMPAKFFQADSRILDYCGKTALMRGPLVYCLEEIDNGAQLQELLIDQHGDIKVEEGVIQSSPTTTLLLDGYRETLRVEELYEPVRQNKRTKVRIKAIPYFQWGNRAKDQEMRVWFRTV
ncbi:glycoside hydrolase family 127 protein [Sphaerochaeta sp.]|uniref:glycoside hydrolase family 127 protein n=1 Tax=Sphaerochaeta sp. TaxID=1972642 RepID=UPI002A359035|nr:beta-L-arabinofuranosidase domain-containing protein [Sphaerochaeta sp.]MDX9985770.1 glycoside hydrolase family 127 protein [Sphaerochaeta sp.]NCB71401.1 glycoside hydrolase family 127 protein [Clostridia bacterium]